MMAITPDNHHPASIDETDNWQAACTLKSETEWRSSPFNRIRSSVQDLGVASGGCGWQISSSTADISETMMGEELDGEMMMMYGSCNWHDSEIIRDGERRSWIQYENREKRSRSKIRRFTVFSASRFFNCTHGAHKWWNMKQIYTCKSPRYVQPDTQRD